MKSVRIHIVVEGQTEEEFVKEVLAPEFASRGISADARLIGVPGRKGGLVSWARLRVDIRELLRGDRSAFTTTLFDFFRIGTDFPSHPFLGTDIGLKRRAVEESMLHGLREFGLGEESLRRFVPYVQMHEFEGILFSDPAALAEGIYCPDLTPKLQQIRNMHASPEHINDGAETAPSKQLLDACPSYRKVVYGNLAAIRVGIRAMRAECLHFNDWLTKLEALE